MPPSWKTVAAGIERQPRRQRRQLARPVIGGERPLRWSGAASARASRTISDGTQVEEGAVAVGRALAGKLVGKRDPPLVDRDRLPGGSPAPWLPAAPGRARRRRAPARPSRRRRRSAAGARRRRRREACCSSTDVMASSPSLRKSSRRQRERMVGSSRPGAWLTSRKTVLAGGSSSILSKALAPSRSRSSTESMTTARQSDSAGRQAEEIAELAHLLDGDVARQPFGFLLRQPLEQAHVGVAAGVEQLGDRGDRRACPSPASSNGGPAASARIRAAALRAKCALPTPRGPASSQAWWSARGVPGAAELLDGAGRARRSRQQVRDCVEQALGHLFGRARRVDQPHPLGLLGGDDPERGLDALVEIARAAADPVAAFIVAGAWRAGAPSSSTSTSVRSGRKPPVANCVNAAHPLDAAGRRRRPGRRARNR